MPTRRALLATPLIWASAFGPAWADTPKDTVVMAGLSHLSFAELGEEACQELLAQGSAIELAFHGVL